MSGNVVGQEQRAQSNNIYILFHRIYQNLPEGWGKGLLILYWGELRGEPPPSQSGIIETLVWCWNVSFNNPIRDSITDLQITVKMSSSCLFVWGLYVQVLRDYPWLCGQESFLGLRGPYMIPRIETWSAPGKSKSLTHQGTIMAALPTFLRENIINMESVSLPSPTSPKKSVLASLHSPFTLKTHPAVA